ncbi:META domain-containing protein [Corynebacterium lowii]|uniref:META domain protein n=1 Tax=Corynebacterium lowii TaxID=1544413 RepID=A0A0Q0UI88_9CORY|nr:META domain-containing protein [Corynebacterium lowii]KQB86065.1 META domain protein [Corynebacterium lowii]MDP9852537.1 heat shock protein HslJ [Corynebacterium lowii]
MSLRFRTAATLAASALVTVGVATATAEESLPVEGALPVEGTTWNFQGSSSAYFTLNDGNIGGNDGCNAFGGSATLEGDTLTVGDLFSTMRYCGDGYELTTALAGEHTVEVQGDTLTLRDENGTEWNFVAAE